MSGCRARIWTTTFEKRPSRKWRPPETRRNGEFVYAHMTWTIRSVTGDSIVQ